jgi:hypothetical protein
MPKGITQEQVNEAADGLVAAGQKPTVEKIREALGTGSPNTVTRMLEVWRGTLAQRLQEAMTLPDVPPEVGQALVEVWRLAVTHAATVARSALTEDQNALFAAQTSLTQERKLWEIALAEAQANVTDCTAKLAQADAQLRERQALVDQLEMQRIDLLQQRDRFHEQMERQRFDVNTLRTESIATKEHVRAMEDRAHQEVDHARQEVKALLLRLEQEQREHVRAMAERAAGEKELRTALRSAERDAAHLAGRVAALERALQAARQPPLTSKPPRRKATQPAPQPRKRAMKLSS